MIWDLLNEDLLQEVSSDAAAAELQEEKDFSSVLNQNEMEFDVDYLQQVTIP